MGVHFLFLCWNSLSVGSANIQLVRTYAVDILSPMLPLCCRFGKVDSLAYKMLYAICLLCQLDMRTEVIPCFCLGEWLSVRALLNSRSIWVSKG